MSSPQLRRADRMMSEQRAWEMLERGFSGRLASVGEDGHPYCIPLLYIWMDGEVYVHTTSARGHFRANVECEPRVCFEIDEPDEVFDYGRFECDSGLAYRSVILFGKIRMADDRATKQRFCEALMAKYGKPDTGRPKGFFPRIDLITVYAISVERMTGKEMALPAQRVMLCTADRDLALFWVGIRASDFSSDAGRASFNLSPLDALLPGEALARWLTAAAR